MRVLIIHNSYQRPGGEDAAVRAEAAMLESGGHRVIRYFRSNDEIQLQTLAEKASMAARTMWSMEAYRAIRQLVRSERPDIAHCHNLFPLISTSAYSACRAEGIPVVQTLHNFRLLCPGGALFREEETCEQCLRMKSLLPGVIHGCYRGSRPATALLASMISFHRRVGTWTERVDAYIALSEFARRKFAEGGLPSSKLEVKTNVAPAQEKPRVVGDSAVYVGRLAPEKGLMTLLTAWKLANISNPLRIIGDGPLRSELEAEAARFGLNQVHFDGQLDHDSVLDAIRSSRFVVFPSECYENCPMAIIEAFSFGVPVIASRLGAAAEMVDDGQTGRLFEAGNIAELARILTRSFANSQEIEFTGINARAEFERKYESTKNLKALEQIYSRAVERRKVAQLN